MGQEVLWHRKQRELSAEIIDEKALSNENSSNESNNNNNNQ